MLTGGRSSRMGRDKATLPLGPSNSPLAAHLASLLTAVTTTALEVGSGVSGLERPAESDSGEGPLVAIATGAVALRERGVGGPVIVLACDLPRLTGNALAAIATAPVAAGSSLVPLLNGRPQPLCARWSVASLDRAIELARSGGRRVLDALEDGEVTFVGAAELGCPDLDGLLADVDDDEDLRRLGLGLGDHKP